MTDSKPRPGIIQEIKITPSMVEKALDQLDRKNEPYFPEGSRLSRTSLLRDQNQK